MSKMYKKAKRFIKNAYWSLDGWRFNDIKKFIKNEYRSSSQESNFVEATSHQLVINSKNKTALISCMYPDATGISTCTLKTIVEANAEIDVYCNIPNLKTQIKIRSQLKQNQNCIDISALHFALLTNKYNKIIVSIGNSDHNYFIIDYISNYNIRQLCASLVLHIHDPCILNIASYVAKKNDRNLTDQIIIDYGQKRIPNALKHELNQCTTDNERISILVQNKIYGITTLINSIGPTHIAFNSNYGLAMYRDDCGMRNSTANVFKLFHPVFASDKRNAPITQPTDTEILIVGSFGIPSKSKLTDLVIEACKLLNDHGTKVKLIIAGYHSFEYRDKHSYTSYEFIEWQDNLNDHELLEFMDVVHVAVQLRLKNLGESSGVVSSLIAKNVPTIVSNIGSFKEYQGNVVLFDNDRPAHNLAEYIKSSAYINHNFDKSIFMQLHNPKNFFEEIDLHTQ